MKYLVTVRLIHEFTLQVSAKDEEAAEEKAAAAWEKVSRYPIDHLLDEKSLLEKFEYGGGDTEFEVEEV